MDEMQNVLADEPIDDTLQSDLDPEATAHTSTADELPVMTALAGSVAADTTHQK